MAEGLSLLKLAALLERGEVNSVASERVCRCMVGDAMALGAMRLRGLGSTVEGDGF